MLRLSKHFFYSTTTAHYQWFSWCFLFHVFTEFMKIESSTCISNSIWYYHIKLKYAYEIQGAIVNKSTGFSASIFSSDNKSSTRSLPQTFHNVRSIQVPAITTVEMNIFWLGKLITQKNKQSYNMREFKITDMEYLMASTAASAGRKSSTATDLFSFFLSVDRESRIYSRNSRYIP